MNEHGMICITIVAKGLKGSGKSRAISAMLKAISDNKEFKILDSRFYEFANEEQQDIEMVLEK